MSTANLCMACMAVRDGAGSCQECGWRDGSPPESPLYLVPGTILQGQYLAGRVLGYGGFGITYLGWDINLGIKVAIKEFMPGGVASRHAGSTQVIVYSGEAKNNFEYGLEAFNEEARTMARFQDHPNIVAVVNFFRANGTGYIVMTYLDGVTLKDYLAQNGGKVKFDQAARILMPVMDALRAVHGAGILHRDVSPDNIFITTSNHIKLIDFGAARYAFGEHSRSLSVILKPGYAPEEQYRSRGEQGPWTDIYALGATFYRAITGQAPPEALDRRDKDDIIPPSAFGIEIPPAAEAALMTSLAVLAPVRFQNVTAFQRAIAPAVGVDDGSGHGKKGDLPPVKRRSVLWIVATVILLIATAATAAGWYTASSRFTDERQQMASRVESLTTERNDFKSKLKTKTDSENDLEKNYPSRQLRITDVDLSNQTRNGQPLGSALDSLLKRFHSTDIRYIGFSLSVENNWVNLQDLKGELGVKYFANGSLMTSSEGHNGYTFTQPVSVADKDKVTGSLGNASQSIYSAGTYRIEFYWNGTKVYEASFEVYD
ncbi:MAG TPA: serine/threonine-protein kinase [Blastocatellia bacterium]|nr:serine/threonine-protein kinase [Blastocatellia bacterium]